jgi:hypothetical protein
MTPEASDALNEAGWSFIAEANKLHIEITPHLWNNLLTCLKPAIVTYISKMAESNVKKELELER